MVLVLHMYEFTLASWQPCLGRYYLPYFAGKEMEAQRLSYLLKITWLVIGSILIQTQAVWPRA